MVPPGKPVELSGRRVSVDFASLEAAKSIYNGLKRHAPRLPACASSTSQHTRCGCFYSRPLCQSVAVSHVVSTCISLMIDDIEYLSSVY